MINHITYFIYTNTKLINLKTKIYFVAQHFHLNKFKSSTILFIPLS